MFLRFVSTKAFIIHHTDAPSYFSLLSPDFGTTTNTQQLVTESRVNWALDEELRDAILGEHIDL